MKISAPDNQLSSMSGGFGLVERELYRFGRLFLQTIFPPIITTILFILIFGYSLGRGIREIEGFAYIIYILPGLAAMGMLTNAFSNASTSLFVSKHDRSIENLLVTPITPIQIVFGFVVGGVARGFLVGSVTLVAASLMVGLEIHNLWLTLLYMVIVSIGFSSFGIISALWSETWDNVAFFSNFILTPLTYLGGVFYSVKMLPGMWQTASKFNPIFYIIDGIRYAVLGVSDVSPITSVLVILVFSLSLFFIAVYLFRIGYKIII